MRKIVRSGISIIMVASILGACSNKGTDSAQPSSKPSAANTENTEPVTLKVYTALGNYNANPTAFDEEVVQPLKKKYPYMTLEQIKVEKGKSMNDLVAAGDIPDIVVDGTASMQNNLLPFKLEYDMSDLIKKYNFPLDSIDPILMNIVKNTTSTPGVWGFPFVQNVFVLFYNKVIFDKFGVSYPKNGMTWDDTYELAKRMTRTEAGVDYRGFSSYYAGIAWSYNQFSLPLLDPKANKGAVNTDGFKKIFNNFLRFYEIPGNAMAKTGEPATFDKGISALSAHTSEKYRQYPSTNAQLDWDMVSLPVYKDLPGIGAQSNPFYFYMTATGKHKDQAFQAIAYLVSKDVQLQAAKEGRIPVLKSSKELQTAFGTEQPLLKGKNVSAFFQNKLADSPPARAAGLANVTANISKPMDNAFVSIAQQQVDVNTALRKADEQINLAIEAEKNK